MSNTSSTSACMDILKYPDDILISILHYTDVFTLLKFARLNHSTLTFIHSHPIVWKCISPFPIQQYPVSNDTSTTHTIGQKVANSLLKHCPLLLQWYSVPIDTLFYPTLYRMASRHYQPLTHQQIQSRFPRARRENMGGVNVYITSHSTQEEPYVSANELRSITCMSGNIHILDSIGLMGASDFTSYGRAKIRAPKWNWLLQNARFSNLCILRIGHPVQLQIDQTTIQLISKLPHLHTLTLLYSRPHVQVGWLQPLSQCPSLTALHFKVDFCDAQRTNLFTVLNLPHLNTLSLECFSIHAYHPAASSSSSSSSSSKPCSFEQLFTTPSLASSLTHLCFRPVSTNITGYTLVHPDADANNIYKDSVYSRTFTQLINLKCIWLALEDYMNIGINKLLPFLTLLPSLQEIYISLNCSYFTDNSQWFTSSFPSYNNLTLLSQQPNITFIGIEHTSDTLHYWWDDDHRRVIDTWMNKIKDIPKVHVQCMYGQTWKLPKNLQQLFRD